MVTTTDRQWLIFELSEQAYGFDVNHVREIVSLRSMRMHHMPQDATFVEGVVLLRDQPVVVLDVRSALGLCSLHQETEGIAKTLQEREEDHCRWIQELEACVNEQREFRLAKNPHKCKFGQWYDKLLSTPQGLSRLTNSDLGVTSLLEQLDQPHKRIHEVADHVLDRVAAGDMQEARRIIDETRNGVLCSLRMIFAKCRERLDIARRGLLFVFTEEDGAVGGLVDRVSEVVRFSEDQIQPVECSGLGKSALIGVARYGDAGKMVQLLDAPTIAHLRRGPPKPSCSI